MVFVARKCPCPGHYAAGVRHMAACCDEPHVDQQHGTYDTCEAGCLNASFSLTSCSMCDDLFCGDCMTDLGICRWCQEGVNGGE